MAIEEIYNPYTQKVEIKSSDVPDYIQATYISPTEIKSPYIAGNKWFIGWELRVWKEWIVIDWTTKIIKSSNYDSWVNWWIIKDNWDAEFNSVDVRWKIEATSWHIEWLLDVWTSWDTIEIDWVNKRIQSSNFATWTTWWRIDKDWHAEFQDVTINQTLNWSEIVDDDWNQPDDNATIWARWWTNITNQPTLWDLAAKDNIWESDIYNAAVSLAKLWSTVVIWWYIKTSVLDVDNIFAQTITATWTITWAMLKTSTSNQRIEMYDDKIKVYDWWVSSTINWVTLWWSAAINISWYVAIKGYPTFYATVTSTTSKTADKWIKVNLGWVEYRLHATVV